MKKNYLSFIYGLLTCLFLLIAGKFGYEFYINYEKEKAEKKEASKPKLTALTSEQIFNKYQDAVVLIKHAFVYKINIGGKDFYFRDFDSNTGEISDFISYEDAKINPNVGWGTGFFIDNNGSVLTNRHVVDVKPNDGEQKQILMAFRNKLSSLVYHLQDNHYSKGEKLNGMKNRIENGYYSDEYEYNELISRFNSMKDEYIQEDSEINNFANYVDNFENQKNYVTKTSLQFGVFFNNQISNNLNDYIQYKSMKISDNPTVDLALLKPVNQTELNGRRYSVSDMSKVDSLMIKPLKITEKVIMIGFNNGANMGVTTEGVKPQLTEGNISQVTDKNKILDTVPALPGSSGSPIFDKFGRVVAVNFSGMLGTQSFNYGIQTQQIKNFLKN